MRTGLNWIWIRTNGAKQWLLWRTVMFSGMTFLWNHSNFPLGGGGRWTNMRYWMIPTVTNHCQNSIQLYYTMGIDPTPPPFPPGFRKLEMSKIQCNVFIYIFIFILNTVRRTTSENRIIPNATYYGQNPAEGTFWWLAPVGLRFSTLDFDYDDYDNNNNNNKLKNQYWALQTYYGKVLM